MGNVTNRDDEINIVNRIAIHSLADIKGDAVTSLRKLDLVCASIARCEKIVEGLDLDLKSETGGIFIDNLMKREPHLRQYRVDGRNPLVNYSIAKGDAEYYKSLDSSGVLSLSRLIWKFVQTSALPAVVMLIVTISGYGYLHVSQNRAKSHELMFTQRHESLKEARRIVADTLGELTIQIPIFDSDVNKQGATYKRELSSLRVQYSKFNLLFAMIGVIPPNYQRVDEIVKALKDSQSSLLGYIECLSTSTGCRISLKPLSDLQNEINKAIMNPSVYE